MDEALMIKEMRVSNFMKLKFVDVVLTPGLNLVTGRNGQGKSSFIKAIEATAGGERHSPEQPIRRGSKQAEIVMDLGRYKIVREWDHKGKSSTVLLDENGDAVKRPAEQLKAIVGELTFDPLAFMEMEPKKQVEILRKLTGLSFSDLDAEHARIFAERGTANKLVAQLEGQLASIPHHTDAPTEEISVSELTGRLRTANTAQRENDAKRRTLSEGRKELVAAKARLDAAMKEVARLERAVVTAREAVEAEKAGVEVLGTAIRDKEKSIDALVDPDTTAIESQIDNAEATNRKVRANAERAKVAARLDSAKKESRGLTKQIEEIATQKLARLEAAQEKMPVPGLSIDGDEVLLNGLPLSQASGGEELTLCCEIGASLNPAFKTMLIHGGERLDKHARTHLAEWSIRRGIQVVMEMRTDGEPGWEGFQLEDGEVVQPPEELVAV